MTLESESEPEPEIEPGTANVVNIYDTADEPKSVSRVKTFSLDLDNCLLRSLLYNETYNDEMPMLIAFTNSKVGRGIRDDAKKTAKRVEKEMEECEEKGDDKEER